MDHVHLVRVHAGELEQLPPPVAGVDHDRVDAVVQASLRSGLTRPGLAREQVMRSQHERPPWQQMNVHRLHGQPLEMHDVGARGDPAVAQHVGHVLDQLGDGPRPRAGRAACVPVEELADREALGRGHRPVREPARDQLHLGARAGQRGAQRVVVRRRERRRVDDLNAHHGCSVIVQRPPRERREPACRGPGTGSAQGLHPGVAVAGESEHRRRQRRQRGRVRIPAGRISQRPHGMTSRDARQRRQPRRDTVVLAEVDAQRAPHGRHRLRSRRCLDPRPVTATASSTSGSPSDGKRVGDQHHAGRFPLVIVGTIREREAGQLLAGQQRIEGQEAGPLEPPRRSRR